MAVIGGQYVSSVTYSVQPVSGTNDNDLTSTTGSGITFSPKEGTEGLFDKNDKPIYDVTLTFRTPGVDSLGSITVNPKSNVDKFSVEFFVPSNPNEPVTASTESADKLTVTSSTSDSSSAAIVRLPSQVPSPLSGIRITVLSTTDKK